jgi:starch synthase
LWPAPKAMRVAHLLRKYDPSEWGGTETAIHQLTSGLAGQNVDSVVYSPRLPHRSTSADPLALAGCMTRQFDACVPVWGISNEQKTQMISVGGNVVSFNLFASLWREKEIDVIHSHALGRLGAIGRTAARARRVPFVLSVHGGAYDLPAVVTRELNRPTIGGWDWGKPVGLLLRARHLFSDADAIITCNPREAELISARHPDRRVMVQPHGVPASRFAVDHRAAAYAAFPEITGRNVFFMPGRIDPVKNQSWLIEQVAELTRRHPEVLLVFVGACTDAAYGDSLNALIASHGLSKFVLLAGKLPPGDPRLIGLLQIAEALVLPSLSETFGLVILEAWAAGTPVISSRTSGAAALVTERENGFLFDLDKPAAFHAAADQILKQPGLRARLGAAGRARVIADYDTAVLSARMKRLYEELIGGKNALRHSA